MFSVSSDLPVSGVCFCNVVLFCGILSDSLARGMCFCNICIGTRGFRLSKFCS